jgi:thiol-disulfide isomerase/thioredoxin
MTAFRPAALALAGCLLLTACADRAPPPAQPDAARPAAKAPAAAARAPADAAPAAASRRDRPALSVALLDGGTYDLASRRGSWVVVNFWATWCAPCLKEMPELSALHSMRDDVEVIGLAYEEIEPADMRAFLAKRPVTYPIAILDTYDPPADFDTPRGLPMTVLIAPDGRVAKKVLGPVTARSLEAAIAAQSGKAKG